MKHVYEELHLDIDYVMPFAAIPEGGRDIGRVDSFSEMVSASHSPCSKHGLSSSPMALITSVVVKTGECHRRPTG